MPVPPSFLGPLPLLATLPRPSLADALLGAAYLFLAVVLWRQRSRHAQPLGPGFVLLAAIVTACGVAHALWLLTAGEGGWWEAGKFAAAALATIGAISVLRFPVTDPYREDLARLRLLATAVSASGDGVMIARLAGNDPQPRIVYANPAFERMTGYSTAEAMGQSPSILPDQEAEPDSLATVRAALRGTQPVRVEVPSRKKDGSRLWTEWQVVPVADEFGHYTHAVAVLRDTTDRRRAEQAMKESESRFRNLFEHAADALFLLDSTGRIVDANRRACLSLMYTREELTTMKVTDLDAGYRFVDLEPGQTLTAENWYRRKDGSTFPVEVRFAALEAGGRRMKMAMVRDVTRRQRAEQALREREELLRMVISHIPCGVFWKDRRSVYLGCNEQVARDWGFASPERLIGKTDLEVCSDPAEAAFYRQCDQHVMTTGEPLLNVDELQTRPNGEQAMLLTSKVPLRDPTGEVMGVLGVYQDITDRKRLEEQLRQAQKMDAIGRLAGGIAHDFNNLLTVIRGNAELLRAEVGEVAGSEDLLTDLRLAADRAAGLVRQLLMFSRRQPNLPEIVDLNDVVAGLVSLLRRLLGERITVETWLAAKPATIRADHSHLEQVVLNLAVNARDAMPEGGTLVIATSLLESEGLARLTVSDTGVGMTPEVKARLFEPFFTTKGPDKGTGLGLATAFGIVEQAGGRITVESEPGAGATFRVDLPWCSATATPAPVLGADEPHEFQPSRQHSVLLVEDEEAVRKLARMTLEGQGYAVTDAPDGETALGWLACGKPIDLLVTDLTMPGIDGRELAGRVRQARPGVGVVFVSGYFPDAGRLDDLPGAMFLPKPFTPADLLRMAGKALPRGVADTPREVELSITS